jgi:excisionase family DNA binding protein
MGKHVEADRKDEPEFVSVEQAAQFVQGSKAKIRHLLMKKKLTTYKFGARTLIKFQELKGLVRRAL